MTDSVISAAIPWPQDEGFPNITESQRPWGSGGTLAMMAQAVDSGSYVRSDSELTFTGHDATNDQVDVTGGVAYLDLGGETVNVQSTLGGSSSPGHDTAIPTLPSVMVVVPDGATGATNLAVQASTLSSVWLAYATDGTVTGVSAGDVYLRSDNDGTATAPPHPYVKLGEANPDNAGADTLANRHPSPQFDVITANDITDSAVAHDLTTGYVAAEHFTEGSISHQNIDQTTVNASDHHTKTTSSEIDHDATTNYVANEHTDYRQDVIETRSESVAGTTIPAGEYIEYSSFVASSETLTVYRWGAYDISQGAAVTDLDVQLVEGDGTSVNTSANTKGDSSLTGVASYSPTAEELVRLRINNGTASEITDVGGEFAWEVA